MGTMQHNGCHASLFRRARVEAAVFLPWRITYGRSRGVDSVHACLTLLMVLFFSFRIGRSGVGGKDPIGSIPSGGKQVRH